LSKPFNGKSDAVWLVAVDPMRSAVPGHL